MSPALEPFNDQSVLPHVLIDRGRILPNLLEIPRDIEEWERTPKIFDQASLAHVAQDPGFDNVAHVDHDVGVGLVHQVELGKVSEQSSVVLVCHGDLDEFREYIVPDPPIGHKRVRQSPDESSDFGTLLVIDEGADSEGLAPKAIGLRIKRKNPFQDFLPIVFLRATITQSVFKKCDHHFVERHLSPNNLPIKIKSSTK